jgi:hypothetical protein
MATPLEEAKTGPVQLPAMNSSTPTVSAGSSRARHSEAQPPREARGALGSTALVVCALTLGITVVCVALAVTGDPTSGAMIAFTSILLGFVTACIFNRRWR